MVPEPTEMPASSSIFNRTVARINFSCESAESSPNGRVLETIGRSISTTRPVGGLLVSEGRASPLNKPRRSGCGNGTACGLAPAAMFEFPGDCARMLLTAGPTPLRLNMACSRDGSVGADHTINFLAIDDHHKTRNALHAKPCGQFTFLIDIHAADRKAIAD